MTIQKKTKISDELLQKKHQLQNLQSILWLTWEAQSKEQLLKIMENTLPKLCQVDSINMSNNTAKKNKNTYQYSFANKEQFVYFYKSSGFVRGQKRFLKKTGEFLEKTFKHLETHYQLKKQKEQWELAFDTIATPISLTDSNGAILKTNKTFRHKARMSKSELSQKNCFQIFFGKPLKGNKRETRIIDGKTECYEIFLQQIPQKNTTIQLVALRDITKQIYIEKQLAHHAQSKEMGIISRSIAHELNNPISGIIAILQTIIMNNTLEDQTKKDMDQMLLAGQRCSQIINKFLNIPYETSLKS